MNSSYSTGFPRKWWRINGGNWRLSFSCCITKLRLTKCLDTGSFVSKPFTKSSMHLSTTSQFCIPFELNRFYWVIWLHDVMLLLSCVVWSYATVGDVFITFEDEGWLFSSWKCSTFLRTCFIWISVNCGLTGLNLIASDELEPFEYDAVNELIVDEWVGLVWQRELATGSKICTGSHQRCFVKKGVLRNFAKFTGKHLCQSLFFNNVAGALLDLVSFEMDRWKNMSETRIRRCLGIVFTHCFFASSGVTSSKWLSNCAMLAVSWAVNTCSLNFCFSDSKFLSFGPPLPFVTFLCALLSYVASLMIDTTQLKNFNLKQIQF